MHYLKRLKRAWAYFIHGYHSYDYDYEFLYKDIIFKLKRMRSRFKSSEYIDHTKSIKQINKVISLLNKVMKNTYSDKPFREHIKKYGNYKPTKVLYDGEVRYLYKWRSKVKSEQEHEQEVKDAKRIVADAWKYKQRDLKLALMIIAKYSHKWSD